MIDSANSPKTPQSRHKMQLEFTSNPRNVAMVEQFVDEVVRQWNVKHELYGNILVAITEAVSNAIIHGNGCCDNKTVRVVGACSGTRLRVVVQDEGVGFNPEALPDPTSPENLDKCGGRGVFLMRQLSDAVAFKDNGRCVEMQFNI